MDLGLKEKKVIISGASRGIGLAVAEGFAGEGANLVFCSRNGEEGQRVAHGIEQRFGVRCFALQADVSRGNEAKRFAHQAMELLGGVDVLINNAGLGSEEKIATAADERWQFYWDLHVMAAVRIVRACLPTMKRQKAGVVLNSASICARQPLDYEPIYNTTKAALLMFGKCLAAEVVADGIRVNTINAGLIRTPDWERTASILGRDQGLNVDQYLADIARRLTPIKRFGRCEELAKTYLFLASDCASYTTGSSIYVDGGMLKVAN